jgi:hypothetical protein
MAGCRRPIIATALLPAMALLAAGTARAAGCDTPLDAAMKLNDVPYRMTMTTKDAPDAPPEVAEIISTDDATYVKVGDGAWRLGPKEDLSLGDADGLAGADGMSCQLLRSEPSRGATADVWRVEDVSDPDEPKHQTVWIARDSGLITRMEVEIDEAGSGVSHMSAEIDYDEVLSPQ